MLPRPQPPAILKPLLAVSFLALPAGQPKAVYTAAFEKMLEDAGETAHQQA